MMRSVTLSLFVCLVTAAHGIVSSPQDAIGYTDGSIESSVRCDRQHSIASRSNGGVTRRTGGTGATQPERYGQDTAQCVNK
jgi:hypothetical protein